MLFNKEIIKLKSSPKAYVTFGLENEIIHGSKSNMNRDYVSPCL